MDEYVAERLLEMSKPVVVELKRTCCACPAQWQGKTSDGRCVYIRYRFGEFSVGIGETMEDAVFDDVYSVHVGDYLDGAMSDEDMQKHAGEVLRFDLGV